MRDQNGSGNKFIIGFSAIIWMAVIFIYYVIIHKPLTPEQAIGILHSVWQLITSILIIVLAGGIGTLVNFEKYISSQLTRITLSVAFGSGVLAIVVFGMGATVGLNYVLWGVLLVAFVIMRRQIAQWLDLWKDIPTLWNGTSGISKIIMAGVALIFLCRLATALAPPLQFDALTYHLAIPKAYLETGRVTYLPNLMFWGMPQQTESLYTLAMLLGGTEAATVFDWAVGLLTVLGVFDVSRRLFGNDSGWVAVSSLLCGVTLASVLGSGYVEWATMLYGFAATVLLIVWVTQPETYSLVIAGVFAGMALGTKYTSGIILVGGIIVILYFRKPFSIKKAIYEVGAFMLSATLITIPWWLKNFVATSNPFYPLFFPAGAMDATRLAFYNFKPLSQDWTRILLIPWQATIWGADGKEGYSASIGPLLLGLSPLAWLFRKNLNNEQRASVALSTTLVLTGFLTWAIGSQFRGLLIQTRLYMVFFPAWTLLCAAGFAYLSQLRSFNVRFGNIAGSLALLALIFVDFEIASRTTGSGAFNFVFGLRSRQTYIDNNLGPYGPAMKYINEMPAGSRVLMLWETRGFECLPKCDSDEIIDRWFHDWRSVQDLDLLLTHWQSEGYTHILINQAGAEFIRKYDHNEPYVGSDWQALESLRSKLMLDESFGDTYFLYGLSSDPLASTHKTVQKALTAQE
jgi:succinate dehydrogenase hydrophobic anchor subunit